MLFAQTATPPPADRFPEAVALHQAGRLPEAEALYRAVLRREPRRAEAWHLLGVLAGQCGKLEAGLELIDQAIDLDPRPAVFHENRAKTLRRLGRGEAAEAAYHAALARAPQQVNLQLGLGRLLLADGRPEEALEPLRRAAVLAPGDASTHATYGAALAQVGEAAPAEMALRKATRLDPENSEHWRNLGHIRRQLGKLPAAGEALERALALAPEASADAAEARYALGLHHLQCGRLADGWRLTLGREAAPSCAAWRRLVPQPRWRGEPLADRRLLLWGEQGVGDEIMFARLLPRALAEAASVAVECDPRLVELYRRSFPGLTCLPRGGALPEEGFDLQAPLGDLAAHWLTSFEAFGSGATYLAPDPQRRAWWRRQLDDGRPLVGLAWRSGNPGNAAARTPPYEAWRPLLARSDLKLVALQYGEIDEDLAIFEQLGGSVERPAGLDLRDDLEGLAALTAALDGVVTIDNATLHLAGALGTPTLGLLPFGPNWRWFEGLAETTPWYGSVRLLRQSAPGDWSGPLAEAARHA